MLNRRRPRHRRPHRGPRRLAEGLVALVVALALSSIAADGMVGPSPRNHGDIVRTETQDRATYESGAPSGSSSTSAFGELTASGAPKQPRETTEARGSSGSQRDRSATTAPGRTSGASASDGDDPTVSSLAGPQASTSAREPSRAISGVFQGGVEEIAAFEAWRGKDAGIVLSFPAKRTWSELRISSTWLSYWSRTAYRSKMVITLGMLPTEDRSASLATGATGAYNDHFRAAAANLVSAGMGNAVIRLGHELNGDWYPWAAQQDPHAFAEFWRQVVTTMRSVPGQSFTFDWNVSVTSSFWDATEAYPGDSFVDYIGQDVYDKKYGDSGATPQERWTSMVEPSTGSRQGLQFWADFAARHGKPVSFAEWGLVGETSELANGGAGGDSPYFVERMHNWFSTHDTAFEIYFDEDTPVNYHELLNGQFPRAADTYLRLFGG